MVSIGDAWGRLRRVLRAFCGDSVSPMDFSKVRRAFKHSSRDSREYELAYRELRARIKDYINVQPQGDEGDPKRIYEYSLVLLQVLLHRATKLFSGSLSALLEDNAYSMSLSIRGHFETTAVLGYLHHRLHSLSKGNLDAKSVDRDICRLLLGTKDKQLLKKNPLKDISLEAKNIMSLPEDADRTVSEHLFQDKPSEHSFLTESYSFLCEFSHPNFHSNTAAFDLNVNENRFYFRHDGKLPEKHVEIIHHLLVSHPIFIGLFDKIPQLLPVN